MKKSINLAYLIWIFSVFFLIQFIISNKDITFYKNLNVANTSTFEILPKAEFRQYFIADEDGLKSLVLRFDTSQKGNSNNIEFELIDNATGNIIHKEILNAEAIPADGYKSISFEKQNSKKHTYYFNLRGISGQSDRHLTLLLDKTSGEHYENSVLSTSSAIYNLSYNIKIYFYLFVSIFFGILGFLFFKYVEIEKYLILKQF